jgi:LysR family transcriptional regulator, transcriptional activator of nhaA
MEWLNYHHLHYFWTVAHAGSLTTAAGQLRLTHSTLSTQIRSLEAFLGGPLFDRRGRSLVLTALGRDVLGYADDVFRLGEELVAMARGRAAPRRALLHLGVVGSIPKTVAYRLFEPALRVEGYGPCSVRQDRLDSLLEDLATGRTQLVLSDAPPPAGQRLRVHCHELGATDIFLYGIPKLARRYRAGFPDSLNGAPVLLPSTGTSLRGLIDRWLAQRSLRVCVEGEFDDAGLMRVFGAYGRGLFPVRAALRAEVEGAHGVKEVGKMDGIKERYYAISAERRIRDPAMSALIERARIGLRAEGGEVDGR